MNNNEMKLKATLKTDISKKSGNQYQYVEICITDNIKKRVFLDPAEVELLKLKEVENDKSFDNYLDRI